MLKRFIRSVAWAAILTQSPLYAQEPVLRPPATSRDSGSLDHADRAFEAPLGAEPRHAASGRYRYQNGRWWYLSRENHWFVWQDGQWTAWSGPIKQEATQTAPFVKSPDFDRRFAAYLDYQTGQRRLQTAEGGEVELATDEISEPGAEDAVAEALEMGGISRRQAERGHTGIRREAEEQRPEWFKTGSPFGVRYGYGSGFGYSGYGYNNPYGYGPRTGSGGAFSYGFGPYGSVGGQTSSRMSGMGGEGPNLISAEPSSLGAPSQLEKGAVGGSVTRASRRKLGGSAASIRGRD